VRFEKATIRCAVGKSLFEIIGHRLGEKAAQAKNAFNLMGGTEEDSLRAEIRLGGDLATAILKRVPLVEENETTRFATDVGRWLSGHVKRKKLPFSFCILAETEPNTIALPGGPVFVSWPLLDLCRGHRDEIAFVLAHEMAHIVRRHALDRMLKDAALSLLLRQTSGRHAASAWLGKVGRQFVESGYSKDEEFEADTFAVNLIETAGGDPAAGEHFLQAIPQRASAHNVTMAGNYFATHPPLEERIANLRAK
jgi:beta-barrel assembly-enhancing protease